jgi:hypothetical protein
LFETAQDRISFDDLTINVTIDPGETVLLAATEDLSDLGRLFFGEPTDHASRAQRLFLIRLVQTQMDDLFDGQATGPRLISTSDP